VGNVLDVALMHVSDQWIPFNFCYETEIKARLCEQVRAFEKPMLFDAEEDSVFPDFWILDLEKDYPMDVFGMATPEYLVRKQTKASTTTVSTAWAAGGTGTLTAPRRQRTFLSSPSRAVSSKRHPG